MVVGSTYTRKSSESRLSGDFLVQVILLHLAAGPFVRIKIDQDNDKLGKFISD